MNFSPVTFSIYIFYFLFSKTCQKGVIAQPCNSQALCHLGNSQLAMHENDPTSDLGKKALLDARLSFRASMENEGKPSIGGDLPAQITGDFSIYNSLLKPVIHSQ